MQVTKSVFLLFPKLPQKIISPVFQLAVLKIFGLHFGLHMGGLVGFVYNWSWPVGHAAQLICVDKAARRSPLRGNSPNKQL